MIQANELRIGNYVRLSKSVTVDENIIKVTPHDISNAYEQNKKGANSFLQPIPLTEHWLIDFGFEIDWIISHKDEYFNLFQQGSEYFYTADMCNHNSIAIDSVHQLQNLYFALTGKELTKQK